jgi:hypothetical protein
MSDSGAIEIEKVTDVRSALLLLRGVARWCEDCAKAYRSSAASIELSRGDVERAAAIINRAADFFDAGHYGAPHE